MNIDNLTALYKILKENGEKIDEDTVRHIQMLTDDDISKIRKNEYPLQAYYFLTCEKIRDAYSKERCDKILNIINESIVKLDSIVVQTATAMTDREYTEKDALDILKMVSRAKSLFQAYNAKKIISTPISNYISMTKFKEIIRLITTNDDTLNAGRATIYLECIQDNERILKLDSTTRIIKSICEAHSDDKQASIALDAAKNCVSMLNSIEDNKLLEETTQKLADTIDILTSKVVDAVKIDWVARIICDEYLLEKGLVYDTVRLICEAKEYRIAQQIAKLVINITSEKISPSDVIAIAEIISKSKGGYQAECATPTAIEAILYAPIETVKELVTIISQADDSYQSDVASCAASLISEPFIQVKNHDKDINVVDLVKLVSKCVGARHAEHVFDIIVSLKHGEYSNIEWKDILELVKIIGQAKTNYQTDYAFSMAENYILIASDLYLKMAKLASKMKNGEQIKIEEAELENIISAVDIASEEEVTDYEKAALYNLFDITENFWDAFVTDPDRAIELLESTYSDRDYDVSEDTRIKVRRKTSEE